MFCLLVLGTEPRALFMPEKNSATELRSTSGFYEMESQCDVHVGLKNHNPAASVSLLLEGTDLGHHAQHLWHIHVPAQRTTCVWKPEDSLRHFPGGFCPP